MKAKAKKRIVHYLNQFFAGFGAEAEAGMPPREIPGPVGPGKLIQEKIGEEGEFVATIACGDNYFIADMDKGADEIVNLINKYKPELVIAGPAFRAGRYGPACGKVVVEVSKRLKIPAFTAMDGENPGVDLFRKEAYILKVGPSVRYMDEAINVISGFLLKLIREEKIGSPEEEGYFPRGMRKNVWATEMGSKRALDLLLKKIREEKFETELPMPVFIKYPPQPATEDLSKARLAIVSDGGVVPKGNPDRLEASSATKILEYDIEGLNSATPDRWETAHGGYDPTFVNANPNRMFPLDVLREFEKAGKIGKLHNKYYVTVGNGTPVDRATRFGEYVAKKLKEAGVDCVIVTSGCGTSQRCGATLTKTIEHEAKIPVVQIAATPPIPLTVGSNRIVPAVAIPHPCGDPKLPLDKEKELRRMIVEEALRALATEVSAQTVFKKVF
ncbi:MAG: Glycine/sarcosine/betaine reductase selenoprotein B (GRDB) [Candidatus Bathyarchaeota archaeon BA1]|nr:MAG: Glycine/sarcosine/betaine reductase selenoprotein B (GRDB) [Candidatus Bathyarchaeota archaeon BA1]